MNVAARDDMISILQNELKDRQKLIDERYKNIQTVKKDNEFLEKVSDDYYNHYEAIKKIKNEQMRSMKILVEYLDHLIKESNMTEESLNYAKNQQSQILNELDTLNDEINKISSITK